MSMEMEMKVTRADHRPVLYQMMSLRYQMMSLVIGMV